MTEDLEPLAQKEITNNIEGMNQIISVLQQENSELKQQLEQKDKQITITDRALKALIESHDHIVAMLGVIINSASKLQLETILAKGSSGGDQQQQQQG